MSSIQIALDRTCTHLQNYSDKSQLSEKSITDLVFSKYDRIQDVNDSCNEPGCSFKRQCLWLCLACGYIGCGENENKHVFQHFDKTGHPHYVSLEQKFVWCYQCYQFVTTDRSTVFFADLMKPQPNRKYDKWRKEQTQTESLQ